LKSLIYLETRIFINSIRNLSRSPKRLIPGLIFFAWLVASIANLWQVTNYTSSHGSPQFDALQAMPIERIETGIFILLASISAVIIYNAFDSGIMAFSISDIDFLFATPLPRQDVLMFRLLKDYLKYTVWVLLMTVFMLPLISAGFGAIGLSLMPEGLVSLSAILALVYLVANVAHLINIIFSFGFHRMQTAGIVVKSIILAIPAMAVVYTLIQFFKTGDIWVSLLWAVDSPIPKYLFAPAKWAAGLLLAPLIGMTGDSWIQLFMLWILAGATFLILLSRRENIYEPAIQTSVKTAKRRSAISSGDQTELSVNRLREKGVKRRGMITLPSSASPLEAVFWKNVLVRYRSSTLRVIFSFLAPILVVVYLWKAIPDRQITAYLPLFIAYMSFILPFSVQPEMRSDLRYAAVIKSTPVSGIGVMLAQAACTLLYAIPGIIGMGLAFWFLMPASRGELLYASSITAVFLLFSNTTAFMIAGLLYPNNKDIAQNYLCVIVGMIFSGIIFAPTVVIAFFTKWYLGLSITGSAAAVCLANVILGAAGVTLAGQIYRAYEPSGE
jgi:hypothetical protein